MNLLRVILACVVLTALSASRIAAQDESPSLVRNVPAAFPPELKARSKSHIRTSRPKACTPRSILELQG